MLKRHPENYIRRPQCRCCGGREYRVDPWMMKRNTRITGCTCAGYPWAGLMTGAMHRRGSLWCWYRANGEQRQPGDPDFRDRNLTEDELEALVA